MKSKYPILLALLIISCKNTRSFRFENVSTLHVDDIVMFNDKIIVSEEFGDMLFELQGDSLKQFKLDSIVSITKCMNGIYTLKAPTDSTAVLERPNKAPIIIKNKSGISSKYFNIRSNEKCEILLESSMIGFQIQNDSIIDFNKVWGFKEINEFGLSGNNKFGYFDNHIFLKTFDGSLYQSYLNNDSTKYLALGKRAIIDFTTFRNELWLITSPFNNPSEQEIVKISNSPPQIKSVEISNKKKVELIYSNADKLFFLSQSEGIFELDGNEMKEILAIDFQSSKVSPEKFIVIDNTILVSTFENGLIKIKIKKGDFDITQISKMKQ